MKFNEDIHRAAFNISVILYINWELLDVLLNLIYWPWTCDLERCAKSCNQETRLSIVQTFDLFLDKKALYCIFPKRNLELKVLMKKHSARYELDVNFYLHSRLSVATRRLYAMAYWLIHCCHRWCWTRTQLQASGSHWLQLLYQEIKTSPCSWFKGV